VDIETVEESLWDLVTCMGTNKVDCRCTKLDIWRKREMFFELAEWLVPIP